MNFSTLSGMLEKRYFQREEEKERKAMTEEELTKRIEEVRAKRPAGFNQPFLERAEAWALGELIKDELPGLDVHVIECDAPYAGSYCIDVTHNFHMIIKSLEQWQERKEYIKKTNDR